MPHPDLPFVTRLWFAWVCFFRVLLDPVFASRAWGVREASPVLPAQLPEAPPAPAAARLEAPRPPDTAPALQLLALLQREGRLVDFIEQDIAGFPDADVGAAARVVHEGCRRAVRGHLELASVRSEEEGARVVLEAGFPASEIKLTGNVQGSAPYAGVLRHRGWRAAKLSLPTAVAGHDPSVLAPAEVEL